MNKKIKVRVANLDIGEFGTLDGTTKAYREGVKVAVYRTAGGGSIYNNVMTQPIGALTSDNGYMEFTDLMPDDTAAEGKFIYTESGELPNTPPPASCRYVIAHRQRLFIIGKDDVVYFSKLA